MLSRGDVLVLALLLALVAWRPLAVLGLAPALVAGGWRWGSTSLEAIAGAQAVLGPAGTAGSVAAAASAWAAGAAVVLTVPDLRGRSGGGWWAPPSGAGERASSSLQPGPRAAQLLAAAAAGTTTAVIAAGPAPGGAIWARVLTGLVATVAGLAVAGLRRRHPRILRWSTTSTLDAASAVAGVGALVLVAAEAPSWSGTTDAGALGAGVVISLAVGLVLVTAAPVAGALRAGRDRGLGSQA